MHTVELDPSYARRIFRNAIEGGMVQEGHLLTAGEHAIVKRALTLPDPTLHVLARLHGRKVQPVRLDRFSVPGISNVQVHIDALIARGFVSPAQLLSHHARKGVLSVPELRSLAVQHGLSPRGNRAALRGRLHNALAPPDGPKMVGLRHYGLFRRLSRAYLQNHSGDLSRVVLNEMGLRTSANYQPSSGNHRFRNRQDLTEYELALNLSRQIVDETNWLDLLTIAQKRLATVPLVSDSRWRFSGRRFYERLALSCLRMSEKILESDQIWAQYQSHLELPLQCPGPVQLRGALAADRAGFPNLGMALCLLHQEGDGRDFAAVRTGKRLARRAGLEWPGAAIPPLPKPVTVTLNQRGQADARAPFGGSVEGAVIRHLWQEKRQAFHVEGRLWTTLFGLLYREAIFARVRGMIPSPYMQGPTDLGTPGFRCRRLAVIEAIEARLHDGQAQRILSENWKKHHREAIAGVHWNLMELPHLLRVLQLLPEVPLVSIMSRFSKHWKHARRGLPDLVVFPGPTGPSQLQLIEVKGPNDSIRDDQRWWIATLLSLGIPAEVWSVKPLTT